MSEKLSLKWNNFQSNISETFSFLRREEKFLDVCLVSEDLVQVSAHQVILCAGSNYFRSVLSLAQDKHHNPLLCLQGVQGQDLQAVLDYIYQGEVQVPETDLESFLSLAQRLQLGGLSNTDRPPSYQDFPPSENKSVKNEIQKKETSTKSSKKKLKKKKLPFSQMTVKNEIQNKETSTKSSPKKVEERKAIISTAEATKDISTVDDNISELEDNILKNFGIKDNGMYYCLHCDKENRHRGHMKAHVESHIEGLSFPCEKCGKIFRSRNSRQSHNSQTHRQSGQVIKSEDN